MFNMFKMKVSKQFVILLILTFAVATAFALRMTFRFTESSHEGAILTQNLQKTFSLNQSIHNGIDKESDLLEKQFTALDRDFIEHHDEINFHLGQRLMEYLRLNLGDPERLSVERIRALHSELAVQSLQIFEQLQTGNHDLALKRMPGMEQLVNDVDKEFVTLNGLQLQKLQELLDQSNQSVKRGFFVIYGFAALFLLMLFSFSFLLRQRILKPLNLMVKATDQIRKENFSTRIPSGRNDEVDQLAQGFNFMAQSLAESYARLEQKVEERTQQLRDLQQQLIQTAKMSAVGQLVGGVAHELNNPLTVILGFAELEKMKLVASQEDPKKIKLMEDIHFQAERCRRIVANLLQVARQEKPQLENIRINEVVERVLQLREYELRTKNIELIREYEVKNPTILADSNKINQVVLNLLNNACDAIQETGRGGKIQVRTKAHHDKVTMELQDDGTGIREPERIFDPFYTTKDVGKGMGLSLSVCYAIVQEHGGEIRAENWAKGARFSVTLPLASAKASRKSSNEVPNFSVQDTLEKRIALIVDDEESILSLQISFLDDLGIEAYGVKSGEEAVQFLQHRPVDLIISDIRMPGALNGIQFYEWVQNNQPKLAHRFLFITGDEGAVRDRQVSSPLEVPCIQKPFRFENFSQLIQQLLEQ